MYRMTEGCTKCHNLLGDIMGIHNTLQSLVFFTISPDPDLVLGKKETFGTILPKHQQKFLLNRFRVCHKKVNTLLLEENLEKSLGFSIHYEFNRQGNLHCHGFMAVPSTIKDFDVWLVNFSKLFAKHFGRQYVNSQVSCRFEWPRDIEDILKYVNKENVFSPTHFIVPIKVVDFVIITKDLGGECFSTSRQSI